MERLQQCAATSRDLVRRRRIRIRTHRRRSERGDDGIVLAPVEESPTGCKLTISLFLRRAERHFLTQHGRRSGPGRNQRPDGRSRRASMHTATRHAIWLMLGRARRTQVKRKYRRTMCAAVVPHIGRARTLQHEAVLAVQPLPEAIYSLSSNVLQKVGTCHDFAPNVTRARASMSRKNPHREPGVCLGAAVTVLAGV